MTTQLSPHHSRRSRDTRHAGARLGRLATVLAAVISGLLASAAAATAAFARTAMIPVRTGGGYNGDPVPAIQTVTRIVGDSRRHGRLADRPDCVSVPPWPPRRRPWSWIASSLAAVASPSPPDSAARNRAHPRLPDERAPGPDRQAGPRVPGSGLRRNRDGRGAQSWALIVSYSPQGVSSGQSHRYAW